MKVNKFLPNRTCDQAFTITDTMKLRKTDINLCLFSMD